MEYWDIYDKNKNLTGKRMARNDFNLADDEYHLSVLGIIKRIDGKYLVTKRKMDKRWAPGWWEVPGGGVQAGESSREAVNREVFEETGIDVSSCGNSFCFDYHRENPGEGDNYFVDVYRFELDFKDEDVKVQIEEADEYRLVTLEEIEAIAAEGKFLHYDSIKEAF